MGSCILMSSLISLAFSVKCEILRKLCPRYRVPSFDYDEVNTAGCPSSRLCLVPGCAPFSPPQTWQALSSWRPVLMLLVLGTLCEWGHACCRFLWLTVVFVGFLLMAHLHPCTVSCCMGRPHWTLSVLVGDFRISTATGIPLCVFWYTCVYNCWVIGNVCIQVVR